jgi:hypothetical protein
MATSDKYLITHTDDNSVERQTQFTDWDTTAFFARLLDERKLSYKVYEKR